MNRDLAVDSVQYALRPELLKLYVVIWFGDALSGFEPFYFLPSLFLRSVLETTTDLLGLLIVAVGVVAVLRIVVTDAVDADE